MEQLLRKIIEIGKAYKSISPDLYKELLTLHKMAAGEKKKLEDAENECLLLKEAHKQMYEGVAKLLSDAPK